LQLFAECLGLSPIELFRQLHYDNGPTRIHFYLPLLS
jgi:hypothetical protein